MDQRIKKNPCLAAGALMELLYLCSGQLESVQRLLGEHLGSLMCGAWQGLSIVLMLSGLLMLTPKGRGYLEKLCIYKGK